MADQSSNPSNLAKIRQLVETLRANQDADPDARRRAVEETLKELGVEPPGGLGQLLATPPPAEQYEKLLKDLEAYESYLISPEFVAKVCKLASPPVFGLHCPYPNQTPGDSGDSGDSGGS